MSDSTKPKRPWYVNCLLVFGGFIVLIIIIAAASGGGSDSSGDSSTNTDTSVVAKTSFALKEEAPAGDLTFTANSVTKKKTIGSSYFSKTSQSGIYAVVNVTVKNNGMDTITIDSSFFSVTDNQGREFSYSTDGQTALMSTGGDNFFLKQAQPGLSATGEVVFEVPEDAAGLALTVKPGVFSSKKATISLE